MSDLPLLGLVMIVKNEVRSIRETIASVRPYIDRYLILDTGSSDDTPNEARKALEGVDGEVVSEEFVDFATTRNRALELLGERTVFSLMLSGDERLLKGAALRAFCEAQRQAEGPEHGAYYLPVKQGKERFDSARLARTAAKWRYEGVTHEVLTNSDKGVPSIRVEHALIQHELMRGHRRAKQARWRLDLKLLKAQARKQPNHGRTQFYLAQTFECLEETRNAYHAYAKRVKMGGWQEEVYESLFRMGRCAEAAGMGWAQAMEHYLMAYAHSPHRAEPLYAIAWHYYQAKNHPLTYLYASKGAEIPYPKSATLFVDEDVYKHKLLDLIGTAAYYVGEFEAGKAALEKALEALPGDKRLETNLSFYVSRDANQAFQLEKAGLREGLLPPKPQRERGGNKPSGSKQAGGKGSSGKHAGGKGGQRSGGRGKAAFDAKGDQKAPADAASDEKDQAGAEAGEQKSRRSRRRRGRGRKPKTAETGATPAADQTNETKASAQASEGGGTGGSAGKGESTPSASSGEKAPKAEANPSKASSGEASAGGNGDAVSPKPAPTPPAKVAAEPPASKSSGPSSEQGEG